MKALRVCVAFLISIFSFGKSPEVNEVKADYYYHHHDHPSYHHHRHYRGGYLYCGICHLYHPAGHRHFHRYTEPRTTVERETVTETYEVVE